MHWRQLRLDITFVFLGSQVGTTNPVCTCIITYIVSTWLCLIRTRTIEDNKDYIFLFIQQDLESPPL